MKSFYTSWSEDFIKNFNFVWKFMANFEETIWKLSNIDKSNLKILSQIWILILVHKSIDHKLDDSWFILLIKFINNLFFTIKMDRATHNDEGSIKSIIILIGVVWVEEETRASNDEVINALLFTVVVDAHVSKNTKG